MVHTIPLFATGCMCPFANRPIALSSSPNASRASGERVPSAATEPTMTPFASAYAHNGQTRNKRYATASKFSRSTRRVPTAVWYAERKDGPKGVLAGSEGLSSIARAKKLRWSNVKAVVKVKKRHQRD